MVDAMYTAVATARGDGRNGEVTSSDGLIDERLAIPRELGGPGGALTNPEQLFAAGYAACFHGALRQAAHRMNVDLADSSVTAEVGIGRNGDVFELTVKLVAHLPGLEEGLAGGLAARAHQSCPYSRATRGNIQVEVVATTY
ncbi:organic hydroperoxide resistance protein [Amycolatopsis rhizosphaerae]|uniref:Organic hydroperoxide resistance protein n=1 Tax=Amycolatopsis rhizosphaerae TaxID=2053003 RepID=A0A558DHM8_9PSEU|nr:organic hydroperoxide resistance protein [Amycolatopsis rhizosphaerae]TVT60528.1 organic hydroperoxide resistance protein [Amycolatopsis rhizosphaerae]